MRVQAAFCGIWGEGRWDNAALPDVAIESSGAARIIYTWGKAPQWRIHKSGFTRAKAASRIVLKTRVPSAVTYQLKGLRERFPNRFE